MAICFYDLFARYLTSSAAAIAVVYEERGAGDKETAVNNETKSGEGVTEKRNGSTGKKRAAASGGNHTVKGPHSGKKQARRQAD